MSSLVIQTGEESHSGLSWPLGYLLWGPALQSSHRLQPADEGPSCLSPLAPGNIQTTPYSASQGYPHTEAPASPSPAFSAPVSPLNLLSPDCIAGSPTAARWQGSSSVCGSCPLTHCTKVSFVG